MYIKQACTSHDKSLHLQGCLICILPCMEVLLHQASASAKWQSFDNGSLHVIYNGAFASCMPFPALDCLLSGASHKPRLACACSKKLLLYRGGANYSTPLSAPAAVHQKPQETAACCICIIGGRLLQDRDILIRIVT